MILDSAINLSKKGFHVFPVKENEKTPLLKGWQASATRNEDTIKEWWGSKPTANIGIAGIRFMEDKHLVIVDVDVAKGKPGMTTFNELKRQGHKFPRTLTQKTWSGGLHLIYWSGQKVKQGVSVLGPAVDIRATGGYIVGAGSRIDDKAYSILIDADVAECPAWILDKCGEEATAEVLTYAVTVDAPGNMARAAVLLAREKGAVEGEGGDTKTFAVAAKLKDLGLSAESAFTLMFDMWNPRCRPPWGAPELRHKVLNAYKHGNRPIGIDTADAAFEVIDGEPEGDFVDKINADHALLTTGSVPIVLHTDIGSKGTPELNLLGRAVFLAKFENFSVRDTLNPKRRSTAGAEWFRSPKRRDVKRIVFKPGVETSDDEYNVWYGYSTPPVPYAEAPPAGQKAFDLFMEHVQSNVAHGIQEHADWFLGYLAHIIQKPMERVQTAIVLTGDKGVGKSAPIDRFGSLLGAHYGTAAHSRYLVGNFNSHLENKLVMVLDEAFWSGDRSADGIIKNLITSPVANIERKGREPYQVDSFCRCFILSNEFKVVNATAAERRYAVFNVADHWRQDNAKFRDMRIGFDQHQGAGVLLDYLQKFDLSKVDIDTIPQTQALDDQKAFSLNALESWWLECLEQGSLDVFGFEEKEWPDRVRLKDIETKLGEILRLRGQRNYDWSAKTVSSTLRKFVPGIDRSILASVDGVRVKAKKLPELDECRQAWDKYMNSKHDWDSTEI